MRRFLRVERALAVKAPPAAVYPLIADFHRWTNWSPYEGRDPDMKRSFGGSAQGKGATYAWDTFLTLATTTAKLGLCFYYLGPGLSDQPDSPISRPDS